MFPFGLPMPWALTWHETILADQLYKWVLVQTIGWTLGAIVVGSVLYPLLQHCRRNAWCSFMGTSPHDFSDALKGMFVPYSGAPSRTTSGDLAALIASAPTSNGLEDGGGLHDEEARACGLLENGRSAASPKHDVSASGTSAR